MDANDMAKKNIRNFTADVRQKSNFRATENTTVGGGQTAGSDRRQGPSRFLIKPVYKRSHFGSRQARDRFGRFRDLPDRTPRDDPLRPTDEGVQDKTIEHDNEMMTTTTTIVLKTNVRVDDDDDEVDHDEDDDDDQSRKRIHVDGGDDEVGHNEDTSSVVAVVEP